MAHAQVIGMDDQHLGIRCESQKLCGLGHQINIQEPERESRAVARDCRPLTRLADPDRTPPKWYLHNPWGICGEFPELEFFKPALESEKHSQYDRSSGSRIELHRQPLNVTNKNNSATPKQHTKLSHSIC